jgi:hypothetical protein
MAQADSNNTTPAPVDSTRRRFMSQAASIAAGSAVLAAGATIPAPAQALQRVPDPILAAIEAHKAAVAATNAALGLHSDLHEELPIEKRRSKFNAWGETIVETDDPRWIAAERGVMQAHNNEEDAACVLVSEPPATMAGVIALLQYAIAADTDGDGWPLLQSDDHKRTRSWQFFLIEMLADVLPGMVQS